MKSYREGEAQDDTEMGYEQKRGMKEKRNLECGRGKMLSLMLVICGNSEGSSAAMEYPVGKGDAEGCLGESWGLDL